MNSYFKASAIIFLLGGILGPLGDIYHVFSMTTGYPDHYAYYVQGIPWWVFPFFGASGLAIGMSYHFMNFQGDKFQSKGFIHAFTGPVIFLLSYFLSGYFTVIKSPTFLNHIILGAIFAIIWWLYGKTWRSLLLSVWFSFLGIIVEVTLVKMGVFWYTSHDNQLFGVASWLPWLYLILAITIGNFTHFLIKKH